MAPGRDSGSRPDRFRFSSQEVGRYRKGRRRGEARPLFRRWEALGLLLLIPVGALFVPGVRGAPAVVTVLLNAAEGGDWRARFFAISPPLLASFFAWRASGRLTRAFASFSGLMAMVTLSTVLVYIAFHLGLHLALRVSATWPWWSPWKATAPGAAVGWAIILLVAAIRFLWGWTAHELDSARTDILKAGDSPTLDEKSTPTEDDR